MTNKLYLADPATFLAELSRDLILSENEKDCLSEKILSEKDLPTSS